MDNSPLNKAHREQRRAEACCRGRRLEEAAECHGRAAELLTAALSLTANTLACQSITLQHQHHLTQEKLLRFRSKQLEKYVKAMENQRLKMVTGSGSGSSSGGVGGGGGGSGSASRELPNTTRKTQAITVQMTRNTEKFDSLLSLLMPEGYTAEGFEKPSEGKTKKKASDDKQATNILKTSSEGDQASIKKEGISSPTKKGSHEEPSKRRESVTGVKKEKDMLMIVEELRTLRDHHSDLITQLMTEVSFLEKENSQLKFQVHDLQGKCEQYEGERRRLRAMADSSCSPFVFSPLSEFSPDAPPDLAPLEMPSLDFMDKADKEF